MSAFADDSLRKTVAKFGSQAVVENQTSAALNASAARSVADSFRNLRPLEESTRRWPSMYNGALGNAGFKQVSAMQQSLAGQYEGHFTQVNKSLDVQSAHIGMQAVQGFVGTHESQLGATLDAFTSPLSEVIRKYSAGYAMPAQRICERIKVILRPLWGIVEWLRRQIERWPRDPYGDPVPFWNVWLYRLAQAAYEGDPVAQARFLNEIEADDFLDNVSLVDELLRPTFDPERPDRRKDWWLTELADARLWLRKRLRDIRIKKDSERKAAERIYAQGERDELLQVQGKHIVRATARDMLDFDPDLIEFERRERATLLRQRIREMLPEILSERQLQIFEFLTHGMTLKQIAHHLGLSESTVKVHAMHMRAKLREKPELLDVLRLNGTLG